MEQPVTVHGTGIAWQKRYRAVIAQGLRTLGHEVKETATEDWSEGTHILLGPNCWRAIAITLASRDQDFITINRAFIGSVLGHETNPYVAIGWNAFNNKARFPFTYQEILKREHPYSRAQPLWRFVEPVAQASGPALILGEYEEFPEFFRDAVADCEHVGLTWWWRPHPQGKTPSRARVCPSKNLAAACRESSVILTHHSTAACEAMLRGTPVVAYDEESMVWPIAQQAPIDDAFRLRLPDRGPWVEWLSWTQWTIDEIASGTPWEWFE